MLVLAVCPLAAAPIDDLTKAASEGDLVAIENLIASGVDLNSRDAKGWYPLGMAAAHGQCEALQLLVERGADLDQETTRHNTALMFAANRGQAEAVMVLVELGADVRKTNIQGLSARAMSARVLPTDVLNLLDRLELIQGRVPEPSPVDP